MIHWFNKYRDKVGMEHVQERPQTVRKSHPHKYPYMWCTVFIISKSVRLRQESYITTTLTGPSQNTACRDIYVGVTCRQFDIRSFLNMFHL